MARSRNIKPGFFVNDDLSECSPLARLLFIGLWTLADCMGRLKDKPRQIKAQILPYDNCNPELLLINLDQSGFIQRYRVQGQPVIQVVNFAKHQNPHKNERDKGSEFGSYEDRDEEKEEKQEDSEVSGKIAIDPDLNQSTPEDSLLRIPDSLLRIPSSLHDDSSAKPKKTEKPKQVKIDLSSWPSKPSQQILDDWLKVRKTKRATNTSTAIEDVGGELHKAVEAGHAVDECIKLAVVKSWAGFKFQWFLNEQEKNKSGNSELDKDFFDNLPDHPGEQSSAINGQCERVDDEQI